MLRARGLVKTYDAPGSTPIRVLDGIDVAVEPGQLVLVAGASGSGKSTLLNVLGLLEEPDAGEVWFGRECVTALGRSKRSRARGRSIGFVFQSFLLLPSLSALDNVLLAARYVGSNGPDVRGRALGLLEEFGMLARRDHRPAQLSGGEQQRVAFCRAILNEPPIILADEPTGNLDDANARVIADALRRRTARGAAVVVVTHRPEALMPATATWTIHDGRLEGSLIKEVAR